MSIFKASLILKSKQKYKGKKKTIDILFSVYSILVETLPMGDIDPSSYFDLVILDFKNHIEIDVALIRKIKNQIKEIEEYMKGISDFEDILSILKLHRTIVYVSLVKNLVEFMGIFFNEIGIKTKTVKVKSDITGILVPTFITDLTPSEQFIEEQITLNQLLAERVFKRIRTNLENEDIELLPKSDKTFELRKNGKVEGYINKLLPEMIFKSLDNLNEALNRKEVIDNHYDKLELGDDGELFTEDGDLITKIETVPYDDIEDEISKYNRKIEEYNQKLPSYQTKLSNKPKNIVLGEHTLKVVNVIHKNIIRSLIIEGNYEGVFLDQMVSSTGKILGSSSVASPYFIENRQQIEMIGDTSKLKVNDIFKMKHSIVSEYIKDYIPTNKVGELVGKSQIFGIDYHTTLEETLVNISDQTRTLKNAKIGIRRLSQLFGLNIIGDFKGPQEIKMKIFSNSKRSPITRKDIFEENIKIETSNINPNIELNRTLIFRDGSPYEVHNDLFIANSCIPDGLGVRVFTQQVKTAVESDFRKITTLAARSDLFVGYHVWPKLGYDGEIEDLTKYFSVPYKLRESESYSPKEKKEPLRKKSKYDNIHPKAIPLITWLEERNLLKTVDVEGKFYYGANLLDIYACKIGDTFLGQDLWKEFGESIDLTFNLSEGSLSRRILDSYITLKAQKEGLSIKDFLNIDYKRYGTQRTLSCLVDRHLKDKPIENMRETLLVAIKNEENGEILEFLSHPKIETLLLDFENNGILTTEIKQSLKEIAEKNQIKFSNIKLGSNRPKQNDPMFRGLDMGILNKIWNEISKIYG